MKIKSMCTQKECGSKKFLKKLVIVSSAFFFSKLKLINKTYLRLAMLHEKIMELAIISREKKMLTKHEYKKLISTFTTQKTRKIKYK